MPSELGRGISAKPSSLTILGLGHSSFVPDLAGRPGSRIRARVLVQADLQLDDCCKLYWEQVGMIPGRFSGRNTPLWHDSFFPGGFEDNQGTF